MPFAQQSNVLAVWARRLCRVLINGPPNSGKTTSLRTWPRPLIVLSMPGENGSTSVVEDEETKSFVWEAPNLDAPNWTAVYAETQRITHEALSGKHGPTTTVAIDGVHKLYDLLLNVATGGAKARGEEFDPRKYGTASSLFFGYVQRVLASPVQYVVMTCWDGREKDDPDEKGANPSRHIFPELPGQAAKGIMGEFAVVLYANREGVGPAARYVWQTRPFGKVWGAGVKMPLEVASKLPLSVPQDWRALEPLLIPQTKGRGNASGGATTPPANVDAHARAPGD